MALVLRVSGGQRCEHGTLSDVSSAHLRCGFVAPKQAQNRDQTKHLAQSGQSKAACSMLQDGQLPLYQMRAPDAWPMETVLDAWMHVAARHYHYKHAQFQKPLDLLEQRLFVLWDPQKALRWLAGLRTSSPSRPSLEAQLLENPWSSQFGAYGGYPYHPWPQLSDGLSAEEQRLAELWEAELRVPGRSYESKLAKALFEHGQDELASCKVWCFTPSGLQREHGGWRRIADWSWLKAACQHLVLRLATAEVRAKEEASRRRLEEVALFSSENNFVCLFGNV